jgi:hypothetical protein
MTYLNWLSEIIRSASDDACLLSGSQTTILAIHSGGSHGRFARNSNADAASA